MQNTAQRPRMLVFVIAIALIPWMTNPAADLRAAVLTFCDLDGNAARLSSSEDSAKLWRLTIGEAEPPTEPVTIVSSYKIQQTTIKGNRGWVDISYQTIGLLKATESGFSLVRRQAVQNLTLKLSRTSRGWKILRSSVSYPPHITPGGLREYLNRLISEKRVSDDEKQNLLHIIDQLKAH